MKKHWVVFVLPAILMVFIATSGYIYLNLDETLSNEELKEEIELSAQLLDDGTVKLEWIWPQMPTEGLYGTDYIGISFKDADMVEPGNVTLQVEPEQSFNGEAVDNGIVFAFPTVMQEHQSVGTRGTIIQEIPEGAENVTISLLHTWTSHEDLILEDALFMDPTFGTAENVQHWVLQRELSELLEN